MATKMVNELKRLNDEIKQSKSELIMEQLKSEWNVLAVGASIDGGTIFEFRKKLNLNIAVTLYKAGTEEKA